LIKGWMGGKCASGCSECSSKEHDRRGRRDRQRNGSAYCPVAVAEAARDSAGNTREARP
jgi:hypothetical protein